MTTARPDPVVLVIVEDSDEDFDTVQEAVRKAGLPAEVRRATTGGDGLAVLRREVGARPVVVLMDLNTPGTDGREALALIKSDPALRAVPVVVLSTSSNPRDAGYCYAAGANAYHVKPLRYPDHVGLVADLLTYWLSRAILPASGGDAA